MTTTQSTLGIGSGGGGSSRSSSPREHGWSDLPDDILDNILLKIASLRDRVRLAAVCMSWSATIARLPAPPAAPLLLLSPRSMTGRLKHLCGSGPSDSWVLRIPDKAADMCLMGSHEGGWVAVFGYGTRTFMLVNLFSGAKVGICPLLPADLWGDLWWCSTCHVIFSEDPASNRGCILATITDHLNNIGLCKVGSHSGWTKHGWKKKTFMDIVFCNGDLYGLTFPDEELVRFKIDMMEDGSPTVTSTHQLAIQRRQYPAIPDDRYMVELYGKPLKAIRTRWLSNREPFFKVFELVDTNVGEAYQYKWEEMSNFGEYALFLGPAKCKAVHVPVGAERRGFERNHIYYSVANRCRENKLPGDELYSVRLDNGRFMYCREDQNIGDGLGRTGYYTTGWECESMWLPPPDL